MGNSGASYTLRETADCFGICSRHLDVNSDTRLEVINQQSFQYLFNVSSDCCDPATRMGNLCAAAAATGWFWTGMTIAERRAVRFVKVGARDWCRS